MSTQANKFLSPEEYLEIERRAAFKSEYYGGEMFAMSGASRRHAIIVNNLGGELRQRLRSKPCETYSSDTRLRVNPIGLYTYPDVIVVCSEPQFAEDQQDTLLNPKVIIEVLSDSTRGYDCGRKFQHYRTLCSLMEYLTVDQYEPHIEHHTRHTGNSWLLTEYSDLAQTIRLSSIDCDLPLSEIYDKIDWASEVR